MVKNYTDPPDYVGPVQERRDDYEEKGHWLAYPLSPDVPITPHVFDGPAGPINCEIHRPKGMDKNAPVLIYYHGGGHVIGSLVTHREACNRLALDIGCVVVAVDYRLAPEHKFPIGINDCLAAFDGVMEQADTLGFDRTRVAMAGDSAGGNISAAVAQQRKNAEHPLRYQVLIVPWLDMSKQTRSYELFAEGFLLEKVEMEWYTNHYLRSDEDALDPMASPLLGDVEGVCPAALVIAGFDPLRDEGVAYGEKLKAAGVEADVRVIEDLVHPFMNFPGRVPAAGAGFQQVVDILRVNLL
ncbi:alpha/beta hydrolase [Ruegeria meonggei]|uniref:Carboxylesterase NlhH n=1 Tax=Ruegeria meonggei TaxID=1446476 RepID=A0A1X7A2G4_9RHOB|nr:alpha/beta hydrolase [Ruegeria meonggei]SLN68720.1 Carboxylesterase NlhH [Ruegeria meonggei]